MGKIIFVTATADIYEKMGKLCAEKEISPGLFERMVAGVNHGEVGALVAKKWNFPEAIVEVIRCHHDTASAKDEHKKLTCLIHFADLLAHYREGIIDWSNFESEELKLFSITDEVQVKELSEKMDAQFKNSER